MQIPPAGVIFHQNYRYLSSQIPALVRHFRQFSFEIFRRTGLPPAKTALLEIGCNDGVFLRPLLARGIRRVVGVDPGPRLPFRNIRCFHHRFSFTLRRAVWLRQQYGQFDIVTGSNVFSHLENLRSTAKGITRLLRPGGWFVCEVHPLLSVVKGFQYDMIYHEHLYYHTVKSMELLLEPVGLRIVDLQPLEMHAGSIRIWAQKTDLEKKKAAALVRWQNMERREKLTEHARLLRFGRAVKRHGQELGRISRKLAHESGPLAGFGASGRANTLLQEARLNRITMQGLADDAPSKQGLKSPGAHLPIYSSKDLAEKRPQSLVLLAWSYQRWILPKIRRLFHNVRKVLIPLPVLRVIEMRD